MGESRRHGHTERQHRSRNSDTSAPGFVQAAVVVAILALLAQGSFHVAHASSTADGLITSSADLVSAKVAMADPFDTAEEIVTFCFDQNVHQDVKANGFTLVDFNAANTVASISARRTGEPKCVDASFAAPTNVRQYSIATVGPGAVKDDRGFDGVQAGVPLEGSQLSSRFGDTTAPQLTEATVDLASSSVTYSFDELLDPTLTRETAGLIPGVPRGIPGGPTGDNVPAPSSFLAWDGDGNAVASATSVESVLENRVKVVFPTDSLVGAVRFGVADGTATAGVADMQRTSRGGQKNAASAVGGATLKPDLAAAAPVVGTNQIDFDFDALVQEPSAAQFFALAQGGERYAATKAISLENGRIRATFNEITNFPERIVSVYVGANAVKLSAEDQVSNLPGSIGIAPSGAAPGFTSGPDLTYVSIDKINHLVRFEFDEVLTRVPVLAPADLAKFKIIAEDGTSGVGQELVAWGDRSVVIGFRGGTVDIQNAVGATVDAAAVSDRQAKTNPIKTLADSTRVEAPGSPADDQDSSLNGVAGLDTVLAVSGGDKTVLENESTTLTFSVTKAGAPVQGATVRLKESGPGEISVAHAQTDVEGRASITALSTGPGLQRLKATLDACSGEACEISTEIRWVEKSSELSCTLVGTRGDDVLRGTRADDVFCGFGGADVIFGGAGDDVLIGGAGNDILRGQDGSDVLRGNGGSDDLSGGRGSDTLHGGSGGDRLDGGTGSDLCTGGRSRRNYTSCEAIEK